MCLLGRSCDHRICRQDWRPLSLAAAPADGSRRRTYVVSMTASAVSVAPLPIETMRKKCLPVGGGPVAGESGMNAICSMTYLGSVIADDIVFEDVPALHP